MKIQTKKAAVIKRCRSCYFPKLSNILSLGNQCLSDFTIGNKKPEKFPLELVLCGKCNLLQLKHTVPQSLLYTERYGYKSGINKTMNDELKEIVKEAIEKIKPNKNNLVLDIGANDGTLLKYYSKSIKKVAVEPIKKFADECEKYVDIVINNFFNYKSYYEKLKIKKANIITAISCFYDINDPNGFIKDIKKILNDDGIFVIQQNYLVSMLKQNAFDNIVHEHLEYYSLLSLENLMNSHGLEIFDVKETSINGGSFRTFIAYKNRRKIEKSVYKMRNYEQKLRLENKKIYEDFADKVRNNRNKLHNLIVKLVKKNKTVYIYGASTRGNTLLQFCSLNQKLIKAAVERNPEKWDKRIASVGIPIISEEQARVENPDYMLVLPWFFKEEFIRREKKYLENGGHFIFPLPNLQIV